MFRFLKAFAIACVPSLCSLTPAIAEPVAGKPFDAAPFGTMTWSADHQSCEIRWGEPRKIRSVVLESSDGQSLPIETRLQYWRGVWNGTPDPVVGEAAAGAQ